MCCWLLIEIWFAACKLTADQRNMRAWSIVEHGNCLQLKNCLLDEGDIYRR